MIEIWKLISNFPNYEVSTHGKIRRVGIHRTIKQSICKANPYPFVSIYHKGRRRVAYVHQLIMETFSSVSPCCLTCGSKKEINHRDGDISHNTFQNLEYVTREQNLKKKVNQKKRKKRMREYYQQSPLKHSKVNRL